MKKIIAILLTAVMVVGLAACSSTGNGTASADTTETGASFPNGKPITIYVGAKAGAQGDIGVRAIVPYLEKILDTSITVVNEPGSSGWVMWLNHKNDAPDGYTWMLTNNTMDYQRLNPSTPHEESSDDYQLLACEIIDKSAIFARADETRWTDFASLVEYAKENEVTASVSGLGTEDANVLYLMNNVLGTKFTPVVAADGSSTGKADVLGGHVDILSDNIGAGGSSVVEGDLRLEVVISSERSKLYPDVPTFEEVTGEAVDSFSARGFMAPKGMDPEVLATIEAAIEEACNDPELVATLADSFLEVDYRDSEGFKELYKQGVDDVMSIKDVLGW